LPNIEAKKDKSDSSSSKSRSRSSSADKRRYRRRKRKSSTDSRSRSRSNTRTKSDNSPNANSNKNKIFITSFGLDAEEEEKSNFFENASSYGVIKKEILKSNNSVSQTNLKKLKEYAIRSSLSRSRSKSPIESAMRNSNKETEAYVYWFFLNLISF
jgi:hypothetical protein